MTLSSVIPGTIRRSKVSVVASWWWEMSRTAILGNPGISGWGSKLIQPPSPAGFRGT